MLVIHVCRKPVVGTVAKTALKYGTGGLDIDGTRLATDENLNGGAYAQNPTPRPNPEEWRFKRGGGPREEVSGEFKQPAGRWPSNVIFRHRDACRQVGVQEIPRRLLDATANVIKGEGRFGHMAGSKAVGEVDETVPVWECADDCPVRALDGQSGTSKSSSGVQKYVRSDTSAWKERGGSFTPGRQWEAVGYGDKGGASRFFKQVGGSKP